MPILSMEEHLKEMRMVQVTVKALRGFNGEDGKTVDKDDIVTVSKGFARQLIHAHQAELVKPDAPAPAPAIVPQDPPLDPPAPEKAPRGKSKD